jgi:hypothetical protein
VCRRRKPQFIRPKQTRVTFGPHTLSPCFPPILPLLPKALAKLGLKAENGISRVTIRKSKNVRRLQVQPFSHLVCARPLTPCPPFLPQVLFVVKKPEVLRNPGSDTYIVFGDAHIEDLSQNAMAKASAAAAARPEEATVPVTSADATPAAEEEVRGSRNRPCTAATPPFWSSPYFNIDSPYPIFSLCSLILNSAGCRRGRGRRDWCGGEGHSAGYGSVEQEPCHRGPYAQEAQQRRR